MLKIAFIALVSLIFLKSYECTTCYVQNSIPNVMSQVCPPNIHQCMKFTCRINGQKRFEQVTKGCNDPANPPVSCTTIMTNCQQQGGMGRCHTCTGDYCNGSVSKIGLVALSLIIPVFFMW